MKPEGNKSVVVLARHRREYGGVSNGKGTQTRGSGRKGSTCEIVLGLGRWSIQGERVVVT
jgi:hypothetical protein